MLFLWQNLSYIIAVCFTGTTIRSSITDGTTSMSGLFTIFTIDNVEDCDDADDNNEDDGGVDDNTGFT